jgi:N utilization substance protein B
VSGSRRRAREAALQILYLWEIGQTTPLEAIDAYFAEHQPEAPEDIRSFASRLVVGTVGELPAIDALIAQHSRHWRLDRLATVDRIVLRMAIWELEHGSDTPAPAVINEALELARQYSGEEAVRFVNGILDAVHKATSTGAGTPPD